MTRTRPTSEQINFRSSKTGQHSLDTYLEAAEKGNRTVPDLLSDIWSDDGTIANDFVELRYFHDVGATGKHVIQSRIGQHTDPNTGWQNVTPFFNIRGLYVPNTRYDPFDLVTTSTGDVYMWTGTDGRGFTTSESQFIAATSTIRIFDHSRAQEWAEKTDGPVEGTAGTASARYSAKYWATNADIVAVSAIASELRQLHAIESTLIAVHSNRANIVSVAQNIADITQFTTVYQGVSGTLPATRIRGNRGPLQNGDLFFRDGNTDPGPYIYITAPAPTGYSVGWNQMFMPASSSDSSTPSTPSASSGFFTVNSSGHATGPVNKNVSVRGHLLARSIESEGALTSATITSTGNLVARGTRNKVPEPTYDTIAQRDADTTDIGDGIICLVRDADGAGTPGHFFYEDNAWHAGSTGLTGRIGASISLKYIYDGNHTVPATGNINGKLFVNAAGTTLTMSVNDAEDTPVNRLAYLQQKFGSTSDTRGYIEVETRHPTTDVISGTYSFPVASYDSNTRRIVFTKPTDEDVVTTGTGLGGNGSTLAVFTIPRGQRGQQGQAGTNAKPGLGTGLRYRRVAVLPSSLSQGTFFIGQIGTTSEEFSFATNDYNNQNVFGLLNIFMGGTLHIYDSVADRHYVWSMSQSSSGLHVVLSAIPNFTNPTSLPATTSDCYIKFYGPNDPIDLTAVDGPITTTGANNHIKTTGASADIVAEEGNLGADHDTTNSRQPDNTQGIVKGAVGLEVTEEITTVQRNRNGSGLKAEGLITRTGNDLIVGQGASNNVKTLVQVDMTGATTGQVPTRQSDGSMALATPASGGGTPPDLSGYLLTENFTTTLTTALSAFASGIDISGRVSGTNSSGADYSFAIRTTHPIGIICTEGPGSVIYTAGAAASIYTLGTNATINTSGANASIYTLGANAHIETRAVGAKVQSQKGNVEALRNSSTAPINTQGNLLAQGVLWLGSLSTADRNRANSGAQTNGAMWLNSTTGKVEIREGGEFKNLTDMGASINTDTGISGQVNVVAQVGTNLQLVGLMEQFIGNATESPTGSVLQLVNRGSNAQDRVWGVRPASAGAAPKGTGTGFKYRRTTGSVTEGRFSLTQHAATATTPETYSLKIHADDVNEQSFGRLLATATTGSVISIYDSVRDRWAFVGAITAFNTTTSVYTLTPFAADNLPSSTSDCYISVDTKNLPYSRQAAGNAQSSAAAQFRFSNTGHTNTQVIGLPSGTTLADWEKFFITIDIAEASTHTGTTNNVLEIPVVSEVLRARAGLTTLGHVPIGSRGATNYKLQLTGPWTGTAREFRVQPVHNNLNDTRAISSLISFVAGIRL